MGTFVCARVVPDGTTHQLIGGLFPVAPGREVIVLDLLDRGEPEELLAYVAGLYRPPVMQTREGEPMVVCTATVEVPDPATAREFLDATYEQGDGHWLEMHDLDEEESVVRAQLRLEGQHISVETASEARMERVLERLADGLPGARVSADHRRPFRPGRDPLPVPGRGLAESPAGMDAVAAGAAGDPAVVAEIQDHMERRWLDEPVPALGGLTPRQAADDPTRRDELRRLLASYPEPEPDSSWFGLRPDRLRRHLGLDA